MEISSNVLWFALFILTAIVLVVWLVRRNIKDGKEYEKEVIQSDIKPELHKDDDQETDQDEESALP
ncbi:hypothetical protein [Arachidicoccus terrestris]|uniref:hypothetical protein n=1 Tax=Arachidicoccus terrestris TaxID=2875539 RepID=UPI001CC6A87B|nr:hypothetical protein [Arachidicoccus terrestris]UAY55217.1 hypothetical protein K9M52_17665 [Arachidicoccus terrestris]